MNHKKYFTVLATCLLSGLALALIVLAVPHAGAKAKTAPREPRSPLDRYILVVDRSDDTEGLLCIFEEPDDCTLRSAITIANADTTNYYTIYFDTDYTINLGSPLNISTKGLYIYGTTPAHSNLTIKINAGGNGQAFIITGTLVELVGLRIYGAGNGSANIWITGSAYGEIIAYNTIGDDNPADGCQVGSSDAFGGIYISAIGSPCLLCNERAWIYGNVIECNGGSPGNGIDVIGTNDVVIGTRPGLSAQFYHRNHIRSNAGNGINIVSYSADNHIALNTIGANTDGSAAAANGWSGIFVGDSSYSTVITGNLVSGNTWAGVWLDNANTITVTHNTIGMNAARTAAIPNGYYGVALTDITYDNLIGGYAANDRNYISGNTLCGVLIQDGATNNVIEGNLIGLNGTGTNAIPNGLAGVAIYNANNNSIGTSAGGVDQVISGNTREGVYIENSTDNFIGQTNLIGVASDGSTALGNGWEGIMLNGASSTTVYPSIVAYNGRAGVAVVGDSATGNKIVIDYDIHGNGGLPIDLGNDGHTENGSHSSTGPNNWINYPVITGGSGSNVSGTACANCTVLFYRGFGNTVAAGGGGKYLNIYPFIVADGSGNWNVALPDGLTRNDVTTIACEPPCSFTSNTSEMSPFTRVVYLPLVLR